MGKAYCVARFTTKYKFSGEHKSLGGCYQENSWKTSDGNFTKQENVDTFPDFEDANQRKTPSVNK